MNIFISQQIKTPFPKLAGVLLLSVLMVASIRSYSQCGGSGSYCNPTATVGPAPNNMGISNVTFGSINNSTGNTTIYADYTSQSTAVAAGSSQSITIGLYANPYGQHCGVWIDWNSDGLFTGSGEQVFNFGGTATIVTSVNGTVTCPTGTSPGAKRMRVVSEYYGQPFPTACTGYYCEFEDYTVVVATPSVNIAAVSLTSPTSWAIGDNTITLKYQNVGLPAITTASFGYSCTNGGGSVVSSVTLASSISTGQTGTYTFATPLNISIGSYTLKVWINNPNGTQPDAVTCNDTVTVTACTGLNGSFTINASGSGSTNFTTIGSAVATLSNCGVSGPVTFTIAPGTYNEQVTIGSISGASATNTITFDGVDTSSRIMTFSTSTSNAAVIQLNGAKYITIKNLTIINTNTTQNTNGYYGVQFTNAANFNNLTGCKITVPNYGAGGVLYPVAVAIVGATYSTAGDNGNNNTIDGNRMIGGYYGMSVFGVSTVTPSTSTGNKITNNKIEMAYYMGIYINYGANLIVDHNTITNAQYTTTDYGIYAYYLNNSSITRNTVNTNNYGIYFYTTNSYNPLTCNITNNMIYSHGTGTTAYGLYINNSYNTNILHNTVVNTKAAGAAFYSTISLGGNRVNNNIFMVTQGIPAMYVANVLTTYFTSLDYNDLVSPAGNPNFCYFGGAYFTNLTALKAANSSFNQNNTGVVPVFQSATNLHLSITQDQTRSLLLAGVTIDIDGETRCSYAPNYGADESGYITSAPSAGFTNGTIYVNSPTTLLNNYSSNLTMLHRWYVDDQFVSSQVNLNHTFLTPGPHNVAIRSTNCSGTDSVTIMVMVVNPSTPPVTSFIASPSTTITNQNVNLIDLSTNGPTSWVWSISPGTVSVDYYFTSGTSAFSRNPVVYFTTSGLYSVCLKTTNALGADSTCKTNYIDVRVAQAMCASPFSTKVSGGNLFSSGGPSGGYGQNQNCIFVIDACADSTYLNVTSASFGSGTTDRFEIYQGDYVAGVSIPVAQFSAPNVYSNLPQVIKVKGKMTVREVTDATLNNGSGIIASWYTTAGTFAAPSGVINGSSNAYYCPTGINNYYSSSFRDPTYTYSWDFDNNGVFDFNGMDGYFSFTSTGPDTIKLRISGCGGTITLSKIVNVIAPPVPTADFSASIYTATSSDTIQLNDLSLGGVNTWKWTITGPGIVNFVSGTTSTTRSPRILGTAPGIYNVKLVITNCNGADSVTYTNVFKIIQYCTPTAGILLADISIASFQMGSINNTITSPPPGTLAYRDFTQTLSTFTDRGATYTFTLTRPSNNNNAGMKIWVDWDQNGIFDPSSELAASTVTGSTSWTSTIYTPKTATLGPTKLRIGLAYNTSSNTPCGANVYGEFQDYRVVVRPDVTTPDLTLGGSNPTLVEIGRNFVESGDIAFDAVDGMITDSIVFTGYISGRGYQMPVIKQATALGTFVVTATVSDFTGNTATKLRQVIVTPDTTKPVITINGTNPTFVEVYSSFTDPGAVASDFYFTTPITVNSVSNVDTAILGQYEVIYTATDVNGNIAVPAVRNVIVRDTQKPVILFPAGTDTVYVEVTSTYVDTGATVTDNYYTGLTATWTGNVNTYIPGTYYYIFTATDGSGNVSIPRTRVIIVRDGTSPQLILASPADPDTLVLEVKKYTAIPEPGYAVIDNYYASAQVTVSKSGSVDLNKIGVYVVTYTATDPAGNVSTPKRRIYKLVDTTKPVITINGTHSMNICRWRPYSEPGATVTDNYWTGLQVVISSNVNISVPGIYTVTYNAVDSSGNIAVTEERYVNVVDYTSELCQAFTGIDTKGNTKNIRVAPNPSSGSVTIDIAFDSEKQREIIIYNSLGQLVKEVANAAVANAKYTVDLTGEASGIYFVTVRSEGNTYTTKFVLSK